MHTSLHHDRSDQSFWDHTALIITNHNSPAHPRWYRSPEVTNDETHTNKQMV